jgi:hypothetical protein
MNQKNGYDDLMGFKGADHVYLNKKGAVVPDFPQLVSINSCSRLAKNIFNSPYNILQAFSFKRIVFAPTGTFIFLNKMT